MPSTPLKTASYLNTVVEYDIKNSCVLLLILVSNRLLVCQIGNYKNLPLFQLALSLLKRF